GGEPFKLGAHFVGVSDLTRGGPAHQRTTIRPQLDETARLELAQRFADRRPADTELLGERLLAQARAGDELTAQHPRLQRRCELVDERPPILGGLRHAGRPSSRTPSQISFRPTSPTKTANTRRSVAAGRASASSAPRTAPTEPINPKRRARPASPTPRRRSANVP